MQRWGLGLATFIGAVLVGHPAYADDTSPSIAVEGVAGVGTPLGWLGARGLFSPIRPLALHAGVGLGSQGVQLEAGARGRLPLGHDFWFAPSLSWSTGPFVYVPFLSEGGANPPMRLWTHAHFVNADLGIERSLGERFAARVFSGAGVVVNGGDSLLVNASPRTSYSQPTKTPFVLFLGAAIAYRIW